MDQRPSLVELRGGKADAELYRRQRDALFQHRVARIEYRDRGAARVIPGCVAQTVDDLRRDIVGHRHAIGCDIAARPIQIGDPDIQRIAPQRTGNVIHHPFDRQHALRPAKPAKRGVGHGVGFQPFGQDLDCGQVIAVVGMKHRPVVDPGGQIERRTAPRRQHQPQRLHAAPVIEPDIIGHAEIVAFAGHHHVVIAVAAELCCASGPGRDQCCCGGKRRGLRFLAPECAAHAPHFDRNIGRCAIEHMRDQMLHFAGMLGGTDHMDLPVFTRQGQRDLPFKIEVILPAHGEAARQALRRIGQCGIGIAPGHALGGFKQRLRGLRLGHGQARRQRFIGDPAQPCRPARGTLAGCGDQEHRLPHIGHHIFGQQPVIARHRADIIGPGNVRRGEHRDHPGCRAHRRQIDAHDPRMRLGALTKRQMQHVGRFGQIVAIARGAADMQMRAVVRVAGLSQSRPPRAAPTPACPALGDKAATADWPQQSAGIAPTRAHHRAG